MNLNEKIFNELKEMHPIDELIKFDDINIGEKLQENEMMVVKYKELYYNELSVLEELERKLEALNGIRYQWYKFEDEKEWQKPEIEKYCLPQDKKILHMKKIIQKQQIRVRFFEMCYRSFERRGWNMKVFSDREKYGV